MSVSTCWLIFNFYTKVALGYLLHFKNLKALSLTFFFVKLSDKTNSNSQLDIIINLDKYKSTLAYF